jgi:hypothetical protein
VKQTRGGQYRTPSAQPDCPPVSAVLSGEQRYFSYIERSNTLQQAPPDLFLKHFFDLSDLLLNFPGVFFGVAFGL